MVCERSFKHAAESDGGKPACTTFTLNYSECARIVCHCLPCRRLPDFGAVCTEGGSHHIRRRSEGRSAQLGRQA